MIQASSQKDKNKMMEGCLREVVPKDYEIYNFGIFREDETYLSYIQVALCVGLLLESKAVDFIITGCSSGQGMMLACNSFSGVTCGYAGNVTDAYLFGRINNGNAISYPLGVNGGWAAEINLKETLKALFCEPFGIGYPPEDAERKKYDTAKWKKMNCVCKKNLTEVLPLLDEDIVKGVLNYDMVYEFIMQKGTNENLKKVLHVLKSAIGKIV